MSEVPTRQDNGFLHELGVRIIRRIRADLPRDTAVGLFDLQAKRFLDIGDRFSPEDFQTQAQPQSWEANYLYYRIVFPAWDAIDPYGHYSSPTELVLVAKNKAGLRAQKVVVLGPRSEQVLWVALIRAGHADAFGYIADWPS